MLSLITRNSLQRDFLKLEFYSFLPVTLGKQLIQELRSLVLFSFGTWSIHKPQKSNCMEWRGSSLILHLPSYHTGTATGKQSYQSLRNLLELPVVVSGIIASPLPFIESLNSVYYDTIFSSFPFFDLIYLGDLFISVYKELLSCLSHCMDIQLFI